MKRAEIDLKRWRDTLVHEDPRVEAATRLVRRYDAETVAFQAKRRVWERLGQEEVKEASWSAYRITAAIVLVLCLGLLLQERLSHEAPPPAVIRTNTTHFSSVTGSVFVSANQGEERQVQVGDEIESLSSIRTQSASASTVDMGDLGQIQIYSQTKLRINKTDQSLKLYLSQGRFLTDINPNANRTPIKVIAGDWLIKVVGTVFEVSRGPNNLLQVNVSRGEVQIEGPDKHIRLRAGERFSSQATLEVLRDLSLESSQENRAALTLPSIPPIKTKRQPHKQTASAIKRASIVNNHSRKPVRQKPKKKPSPAVRTPPTKAKPVPLSPPLAANRPLAMRAISLPDSQLSPSEVKGDILQYDNADREVDPQRSMNMFDAIAEGDSDYAELAAHRAANIALRQGDDDEALRRYLVIRDRFGRGIHAKETATSLVALRIKHCKLHEGRGDLNRFFRENPEFGDSKELAFLSGELHRRTKKYARALKAYTTALGSRHDEDALYFRAWCLLAIDKNSLDARSVLQDYLKKYPHGRHKAEVQRVLQKPLASTK
jgi:ferric-dicitrate binding protein FerR (iron transport regulator)